MYKTILALLAFVGIVGGANAQSDRGLEISTETVEVSITVPEVHGAGATARQAALLKGWAAASVLVDRGVAPGITFGSGHFYLEAAARGSTDREHLGVGWVALLPEPSKTGFLWLSVGQEKSGRESGSRLAGGWGIVKPISSDLGFIGQIGVVRHGAEGRTVPAAQLGLMTSF